MFRHVHSGRGHCATYGSLKKSSYRLLFLDTESLRTRKPLPSAVGAFPLRP